MNTNKFDFAGGYDETELVQLSETEEHGAGTPTITVTVPISLALCPTTVCTGDC